MMHWIKKEMQGQIPIVARRRDYCDWVVIMYAKDWFKIYKDWEMSRNQKNKFMWYDDQQRVSISS